MCQVAHCTLCVMCTTHVQCNPGPWPSVWQDAWVPQAVGPIQFGYRGGLGSPKARPRPPMGHLTAPTCCMPALVGQLGPWGHWVVAPGAHTTPPWVQWGAQVDAIINLMLWSMHLHLPELVFRKSTLHLQAEALVRCDAAT